MGQKIHTQVRVNQVTCHHGHKTHTQGRVNQHNLWNKRGFKSLALCLSPAVLSLPLWAPVQERGNRYSGSLSRWRARPEPAPLSDSTADSVVGDTHWQPCCQDTDPVCGFPLSEANDALSDGAATGEMTSTSQWLPCPPFNPSVATMKEGILYHFTLEWQHSWLLSYV